jgi:hypothetical protein
MRSDSDGSTRVDSPSSEPVSTPANAFSADFLSRLDERDEPPTAREAEYAGPWRMEALPEAMGGGFGLFRHGESLARGHRPFGAFESKWMAQLAAAILLLSGRDASYRMRETAEDDGYAIESRAAWGAVVGRVEHFDPHLIDGLHVADGLMRTPEALALFLEACGRVALERAGAILGAQV